MLLYINNVIFITFVDYPPLLGGRMGYVPAYGGNGNSRNVSCSKPSLHCPREGALYKWLTKKRPRRHACDAI